MTEKKANIAAVVPPKIARGKRGTQLDKTYLTELAGVMAGDMELDDGTTGPAFASDQIEYKSRGAANSQAMRVRKALANDSDFPFTSVKEIQSRVWGSGEVDEKDEEKGPFYFAVARKVTTE